MKFDALPNTVRTTLSRAIDPDHIGKIENITDTGYVKFEITSTKTAN